MLITRRQVSFLVVFNLQSGHLVNNLLDKHYQYNNIWYTHWQKLFRTIRCGCQNVCASAEVQRTWVVDLASVLLQKHLEDFVIQSKRQPTRQMKIDRRAWHVGIEQDLYIRGPGGYIWSERGANLHQKPDVSIPL